MKTEKTREIIQHFYDSLDEPSRPLSKWEEGFIADTRDYFDRSGTLSDRQFEILERIYAEKTA